MKDSQLIIKILINDAVATLTCNTKTFEQGLIQK